MGVIVSGVVVRVPGAFARLSDRCDGSNLIVSGVVVGALARPVRPRARQRRWCWWCIRAPGAVARPSAGLLLVCSRARCVRAPRCVPDGPGLLLRPKTKTLILQSRALADAIASAAAKSSGAIRRERHVQHVSHISDGGRAQPITEVLTMHLLRRSVSRRSARRGIQNIACVGV